MLNDTRPTILIVDDNEICLMATEQFLKNIGCNVVTATSGEEALAIVQYNLPFKCDAIISDYNMPGINGDELLKECLLIPEYKNTPMIINSANPDTQHLAKLSGIEWLPKPLFCKDLEQFLLKNKIIPEQESIIDEMFVTERTIASDTAISPATETAPSAVVERTPIVSFWQVLCTVCATSLLAAYTLCFAGEESNILSTVLGDTIETVTDFN